MTDHEEPGEAGASEAARGDALEAVGAREAEAAEADAALEAAALAQAAGDDDADGPSSAEYSIAFTPRNVAVGLAIVAGVVAFVASRRRRARAKDG